VEREVREVVVGQQPVARILNEGLSRTVVVAVAALQLQAPLETPEIRGQPHPL
jgi:hypothetical protein